MPRRRYDDDEEGFPDIRQKPGTPSDAFGGAYGPPDSDSESGYSRPGTAGSGESGSASLTFEDWQKKAGLGSIGGEDEFSKTDGSARDARRRDVAPFGDRAAGPVHSAFLSYQCLGIGAG